MIQNNILGAVYLSAIDMILLVTFLYLLGLLFKLFPLLNKITFGRRKEHSHDNYKRS